MRLKVVQTGYALGISLLLTSIFYLFASNWQSFDRYSKIGLSIGLLILFYLLHFMLRKVLKQQHFLGNWLLVAAGIVFGVTLALIGQIYNSHADSYLLYLIWFIPMILLAIFTKYHPFYLLSFILAHLSIFMFMTPSSYFPEWNPVAFFWMYIGIMLLNAILFLFCYRKMLTSKTIYYVSYLMFFSIFFIVTITEDLPLFYLNNLIYIAILIWMIYYWAKIDKQHALLVITSIYAAIYLLYKVFYWVFTHYGTWMLIFLLAFSMLLVFISVVIVGLLNKGKSNRFMIQLITILITFIATFFATLAITGLFFIIFPTATTDALFFFAIVALLLPGLFIKLPSQIRYTLIGTGFLLSYSTSVFSNVTVYPYILLLFLLIGLFIVQMKGIKVLLYIAVTLTLSAIFLNVTTYDGMVLWMMMIHFGYYLIQRKEIATKRAAFIIGFLYFMNSTFLHVSTALEIVSNLGFFIITTLLVLLLHRDKQRFEWIASLVFWFLFIVYKYYQYVWDLVHQSILCLIVGLLLIGMSYYIQRKNNVQSNHTYKIRYKLPIILAIIVLQFAFIGYQTGTSEHLLKEGTSIKLELKPVDPRSMIQGDYLILAYDISDIDAQIPYDSWNKKVKVVLREENGVHQYAGFYKINDEWNKPYEKQSGDVIINGKMYSPSQIQYGIESYFVPAGKGLDLQNNVTYAYVRVGKSGNAILEKVE